MNYKKLCKIADATETIEVGGTFDNGEVKGRIKEIITAEDGTKTVKVETQNEEGNVEDVEVAIEDSKIKDNIISDKALYASSVLSFYLYAGSKDDVLKELDNDIISDAEDLTENGIKNSDYLLYHWDEHTGKGYIKSFDSDKDVKEAAREIIKSYLDSGEVSKEDIKIEDSKIKDSEDYTFKVVYADPETGEKKIEIFSGNNALDAAHDFIDNLTPGSYKITRVYDSKILDDFTEFDEEKLYEESLNKPTRELEPFKAVTEEAIDEFLETGEAFIDCSAEDAEEIAKDVIFVLKGYTPEDTTMDFGWDYLENMGQLHIFGVVD